VAGVRVREVVVRLSRVRVPALSSRRTVKPASVSKQGSVVSASPKVVKPLTKFQWWTLLVVVVLCGVAALVVMASVAGKHGACPGETQTSRPGAASCYAAYQNQDSSGVVGASAAPVSSASAAS